MTLVEEPHSMTIRDPNRLQATAEMAAAVRTLDASPLTRAMGENAADVRLNGGMAILCAYAAQRHLAEQENPPDEELQGIARAHLPVEDVQTRVLAALSGNEPEDCWAVDDSRGLLCYRCDYEGDDSRHFPCLSCPLVTRHLPNIVEPLNIEAAETPLPDRHSDPIAAVRDAAETLDTIHRATEALGQCVPNADLLAAAIAMANAARYTVAAVECYPPHIGHRNIQRLAARELEIADGLYLAIGGDAERGSIHPKWNGEPCCVRVLSVPKEDVIFMCDPPDGFMPPEAEPNGDTATMCEHCRFRGQEHRPRIDQVVGRR